MFNVFSCVPDDDDSAQFFHCAVELWQQNYDSTEKKVDLWYHKNYLFNFSPLFVHNINTEFSYISPVWGQTRHDNSSVMLVYSA